MASVVDVSVTVAGMLTGCVHTLHVSEPVQHDAAVHVRVVVGPQYPFRQLHVVVVPGTVTVVQLPPVTVGVPQALQSGVAGQHPVVAHVKS